MPGRRPRTVAGAEREEAILKALEMGGTRRAASAAADVSHDTFQRMMVDASFASAVQRAEGRAEMTHTVIVAEAATKSWQAAAWWLERRRNSDYGRHDRVDVTIDSRQEAERLAAELGLDVDGLMAEAEAILRG